MASGPNARVEEEQIMSDPVSGPLEPYAEGFRRELAAAGYTRQSVCRHLRLMAEVSRWLGATGDREPIPAEVLAFLAERRRGRRQVTAKMLEPLVDYLGRAGAMPTAASVQSLSE